MADRFIARAMMTAIFFASGAMKLQNFDNMSVVVGGAITATGLYTPTPEVAKLCLAVAVMLELVGGAMFLLGKEKLGAHLLAAFLLLVRAYVRTPVCAGLWAPLRASPSHPRTPCRHR